MERYAGRGSELHCAVIAACWSGYGDHRPEGVIARRQEFGSVVADLLSCKPVMALAAGVIDEKDGPRPALSRVMGQELHVAADPRRPGEPAVCGEQRQSEGLSESDVAGVVDREVLPELPAAGQ